MTLDAKTLHPQNHLEMYKTFRNEYPGKPELLVLRPRDMGFCRRFHYYAGTGPPINLWKEYILQGQPEAGIESFFAKNGGLSVYADWDISAPHEKQGELGLLVRGLSLCRSNEDGIRTMLLDIPELGAYERGLEAFKDFLTSPQKPSPGFTEAAKFEESMREESEFFVNREAFEALLGLLGDDNFPADTFSTMSIGTVESRPFVKLITAYKSGNSVSHGTYDKDGHYNYS